MRIFHIMVAFILFKFGGKIIGKVIKIDLKIV